MGSENEIPRWGIKASEATDAPWVTDIGHPQVYEQDSEGEWVRWPDHVAARKADQERIDTLEVEKQHLRVQFDERQDRVRELEASLAAAEKLADAVSANHRYGTSGCPCGQCESVSTALAAFRASLSTGEREGEWVCTGWDGHEPTYERVEGGSAAGVTKNDGVNTTEGEDEN